MENLALDYACYLSYENTSALITRTCGNSSLSSQHIGNLVKKKSQQISERQKSSIAIFSASQAIVEAVEVDIYTDSNDGKVNEIVYFSDDVCVKTQKAKRDKILKIGRQFSSTRVRMFSLGKDNFQTVVAGCEVNAVDLVKTRLWEKYGSQSHCLPIVAITDGATTLKIELTAIFGKAVIHILDWYHLHHKITQTMTMIAHKESCKQYKQDLLALLWDGKTQEAIKYLEKIAPKNEKSKAMLITYLNKNSTTIIDYNRRKALGRTIGSGRGEKQNDILVAKRQKYKAMAWSPKGSLALALVIANKIAK